MYTIIDSMQTPTYKNYKCHTLRSYATGCKHSDEVMS